MLYAICPACGEDVRFREQPQVGQNMVCPRCKELLAVVTLDPIILELYKITVNNGWMNEDKQEGAKRHDRKVKNRHGENDDFDERENDLKKALRKSKSRSRMDW